ncbi:proline-rich receptor-like protein kinase PERK9 [Iris pallida]|uniref:Proline-rich receptor-like protein kinase PERK9 n=1 Tax=Iris pallida TaxID=29817 RepID=A0AAX6FZ41_IRIPA|nr:proline-rich receptor-like protein kinase PERK9 [Iris pallida]
MLLVCFDDLFDFGIFQILWKHFFDYSFIYKLFWFLVKTWFCDFLGNSENYFGRDSVSSDITSGISISFQDFEFISESSFVVKLGYPWFGIYFAGKIGRFPSFGLSRK